MKETRNERLIRRLQENASSDRRLNQSAKQFRSDNDVRQFWAEARIVLALTSLSFLFVAGLDIPFEYSPVAAIPGVLFLAFSRFVTWLNRRRGKRFSSYDQINFDD